MKEFRTVKKLVKGFRTQDGAGVNLVRVLGHETTEDFDPFLMLDAFDSSDPNDYTQGFPWHPHRGIETITYLIQGNIEHEDSLGNKGLICDGDCQWMTAGSGIIHQEMPKTSERMLGAQLWLNLPATEKMTEPQYGDINSKNVPLIEEDGVSIRIVAGKYKDVKGAFQGKYIDTDYYDVLIEPHTEWMLETKSDNTLFVYIFEGSAQFDPNDLTEINEKQAVLFDHGNNLWVKTFENSIRFILLSAKPLKEPIAWGGPIVMNTQEELDFAFDEIKKNEFIKHER